MDRVFDDPLKSKLGYFFVLGPLLHSKCLFFQRSKKVPVVPFLQSLAQIQTERTLGGIKMAAKGGVKICIHNMWFMSVP